MRLGCLALAGSADREKYWGTSEWQSDEIERAHHIATKLNMVGPVMEQPQYNLLARERVEKEYQLLYEVYGMGLTPFSPLKVSQSCVNDSSVQWLTLSIRVVS